MRLYILALVFAFATLQSFVKQAAIGEFYECALTPISGEGWDELS